MTRPPDTEPPRGISPQERVAALSPGFDLEKMSSPISRGTVAGSARFRDTGEELYEPVILESLMPDTTVFHVDCRAVTTLTGVVTPASERVPEKKQVRV